jgi:hypothetical protein
MKNFLPGIFIVEGFGFDGLFGVQALYLAGVEQAGQADVGRLRRVGVEGFGYGRFAQVQGVAEAHELFHAVLHPVVNYVGELAEEGRFVRTGGWGGKVERFGENLCWLDGGVSFFGLQLFL